MFGFFRKRQAFPDAWHKYLDENVVLHHLLSEDRRDKLRTLIPNFIAHKFWEGCAGLEITEEIQVTVAGQACLLLLGFEKYLFDELRTVLVYPGGYLGLEEDPFGRGSKVEYRLGEAHQGGPVVLSWWHACWDGQQLGTDNLVLHEFAHKLAELGGREAWVPPLADEATTQRWEEVVRAEYDHLVEQVADEQPTLIDPYGATNPAEFFAVSTECFFMRSSEMNGLHPELYALLADFYRQDPASWSAPPDLVARLRPTSARERERLQHDLSECSVAIQRRPRYISAYETRISCYRALGEYDHAITDCTTLMGMLRENQRDEILFQRGQIYLEADQLDHALADINEVIHRCPEDVRGYLVRARIHQMLGEHHKARQDRHRARRMERGRPYAF